MPTYTIASLSKSARSAGFTLVELLVVVVIVAITVSIALLSLGVVDNDREIETEARRFAAIYEQLLDEASLQGREYGIEVMTAGYRFVEYDTLNSLWIAIPGDEMLRHRNLPDDIEFELFMEDKRVLLESEAAELDDPDRDPQRRSTPKYAPHLLVFSSGDTTPFELHVWRTWDDARVVVNGDPLGTIEFSEDEE